MLAKISQTDFPAKEINYHRLFYAKYQTEAEPIFQSKNIKTPNDASSTHSKIYYEWHKEKQVHSEAFDALIHFIKVQITIMLWINDWWHLLNDFID